MPDINDVMSWTILAFICLGILLLRAKGFELPWWMVLLAALLGLVIWFLGYVLVGTFRADIS
jgi:RsiW-degrading membrane proteinase PrsW (M82 family)